jgi:formate dehydrogenase subunit delta
MNTDYLIKMINEIAAFFAGDAGPEQAPQEVATHLKKFWEARMRSAIVAHYKSGAAGLSDVARGAVALLAAEELQS